MHPLKLMSIGIIISVLFGIVGRMDYDDALLEADAYCGNVYSGLWPDYDKTYDKECKDGKYIRKD